MVKTIENAIENWIMIWNKTIKLLYVRFIWSKVKYTHHPDDSPRFLALYNSFKIGETWEEFSLNLLRILKSASFIICKIYYSKLGLKHWMGNIAYVFVVGVDEHGSKCSLNLLWKRAT